MKYYWKIAGLCAGGVLLAGSMVFNFVNAVQNRQIRKKLNCAIDDIKLSTPIDVKEEIIDQAIREAVSKEIDYRVSGAVKKANESIRKDTEKAIREEVDSSRERIASEVSEEISNQVASLDIEKLKEIASKKAEQTMLKKLNSSMESILSDFTDQVAVITKFRNAVLKALDPLEDNGAKTRNGTDRDITLHF